MRSDERASSPCPNFRTSRPVLSLLEFLTPDRQMRMHRSPLEALRQAEYKSMVELHNKYSAQGFGECEPVACPLFPSERLS
jgi:hypothetical protein